MATDVGNGGGRWSYQQIDRDIWRGVLIPTQDPTLTVEREGWVFYRCRETLALVAVNTVYQVFRVFSVANIRQVTRESKAYLDSLINEALAEAEPPALLWEVEL